MNQISASRLNLIYALAWILIALFQSWYTPLFNDEGHYWFMGHYLDWGSFDHPPGIAVLVKMGCTVFPGELGVRIGVIIASLISIYFLQKTINQLNPHFFWLTAFSCMAMNYTATVACPDAPLLMVTSVYFFIIKQISERGFNPQRIVVLGVLFAALIYSKYHGILIIGFSLVFFLKWFKEKGLWASVLLSILLFLPHIYWQYKHEFITIRFHLFHRAKTPFQWNYPVQYILGHLGLFGAIATVGMHLVFKKIKQFNSFERMCAFVYFSIFFFFLLLSFRSRVEANWTTSAAIPFLIIVNNYQNSFKQWKTLRLNVFLILLFKLYCTELFSPNNKWLTRNFFEDKDVYPIVDSVAQGRPVVFFNSYRRAGIHQFLYGGEPFSFNDVNGRMNAYNHTDFEKKIVGKKVVVIANYYDQHLKCATMPSGNKLCYEYVDNYCSFTRIAFKSDASAVECERGKPFTINLTTNFEVSDTAYLSQKYWPSYIGYAYYYKNKFYSEIRSYKKIDAQLILNNTISVTATAPTEPGEYELFVGIATGWLGLTNNIEPIVVKVN